MGRLPTLVSLLERAGTCFRRTDIVSQRPDDTLHRYTYGDFYRRTRSLAAALQDYGLRQGDRVATLMSNHHMHLEAYFGVPAIGGVLHTMNPCLPADELVYTINDAGDRLLIADDVMLPVLDQIAPRLHVERIIVAPFKGYPACRRYDAYEELLEDSSGDPRYAVLHEGTPAGVWYTPCSAGGPVAVVYSHGALAMHAYSLPENFSIGRHDTILSATSTCQSDPWGLPYAAIMHGSKLVLPGLNLEPEHVLDLVYEQHVTVMGTTPAVWLGVLDALNREPERWQLLQGTRVVVGDPDGPDRLFRRLDAFGMRAIRPWALTEMAPLGGHATWVASADELDFDREFREWKVLVES